MNNQGKTTLPFLNNGIAQVAILVPDLMETIHYYYHDFGIGPWHIYTYGKPLTKKMSYMGKPADYQMRIGLSYFGSMRIELIQPLSGESIYADFIKEHGYGVHHFGLLTENMTDSIQLANKAGYVVTMDGAGFGLDGDGHYAYLNTEDKLGVTLELIERPDRRVQPEQIYPPGDTNEHN